MTEILTDSNETYAEEAFSKQSDIFDETYAGNTIVSYKRKQVRDHVQQYLRVHGSILELNSGTGDDALFFAKKGHHVHATDISQGMQRQLKAKAAKNNMDHLISNEICSYTQLDLLKDKGPYDHIFSNFAGLNCTGDLDKVLASFPPLLKKDGVVTLVILPKFCLWEFLLIFKGKFRTAFRRLFSKNGVKAHLEGTYFTCWYYNPSYIINATKDTFDVLSVEGLCTIVPPSYIEGFAEKHPAAYKFLKRAEARLRYSWPWKYIGDYYIISLVKK
jgi:ubiquinone/menaquinone biosynthesis C-methylase UbiE